MRRASLVAVLGLALATPAPAAERTILAVGAHAGEVELSSGAVLAATNASATAS